MYYIYKITNLKTKKIYIGQTDNLKRRKYQHFYYADKNADKGSPYLYSSIRKYGKKNFSFEEIEYCETLDLANKKETYYIRKYNTLMPNGYNGNEGGDCIRNICEETRKKLSKATSGSNNPMFGKKRTQKSIQKAKLTKGTKRYECSLKGVGHICIIDLCSYARANNLDSSVLRKVCIGERASYKRHFSLIKKDKRKTKKTYKVKDLNGNIIEIKNLKKFCKNNNLTESIFRKIANCNYKYHSYKGYCRVDGRGIKRKKYKYTFTSPQGQILTTNELDKFLSENNIDKATAYLILNNKEKITKGKNGKIYKKVPSDYKGWKMKKSLMVTI